MKKDKVSIIVPIYNRENLITKCVNSLINQTYKNIEIVLVDDGSKDNSYKIIKEYAKENNNIKAYHKDNGGVGSARNYGIEKATGKYITFVDSDDYIEKDYIASLMKHSSYDFVCSAYTMVDSNDEVIKVQSLQNNPYAIYRYPIVMAKLYKTDIIKNNNISFSKTNIAEDTRFTIEYLSKISNGIGISYNGYKNVDGNHNKLTNDLGVLKKKRIDITFENIDDILESFIDNNIYSKYVYYFIMKELASDIILKSKYASYKELKEYNKYEFNYIKDAFNKKNIKIKCYFNKYDNKYANIFLNMYIISYKLKLTNLYLRLLSIFLKKESK